jgi:putative membrane protein
MLRMKILSDATGFRLRSSAKTTARKVTPMLAAGCFVLLGTAGSVIAGTLDDAQILGIYIQVNGFDAETALLGRALSHSSAVRNFATHVSTDHLGVRQTAYKLAAKCKVSPVTPSERDAAAIEHGQEMMKLSGLKGAEFDKAFLRHEVAFHTAAIEAVRQLLEPSATCSDLRAHFKEALPAFEHHLSETQALAREQNGR